MESLLTSENLIALATLVVLEIVLGVDNVIFIAILSNKLPKHQQDLGRSIGIGLAVITRILLLLTITWVMRLTQPLLTILGNGLSGRDLILLGGGLFLIAKSTYEIHEKLEAVERPPTTRTAASLAAVIVQIVLIDVVFSLDSVITAVGLSGVLWVMITAVVVAAGVMVVFAGAIGRFVEEHPTMKILALAFLILIGFLLVLEGWIPEAVEELRLRNYAYFAMAFSFGVEMINLRLRKAYAPVRLHNRPSMEELERTS